jgi:ribonuclease P protein component
MKMEIKIGCVSLIKRACKNKQLIDKKNIIIIPKKNIKQANKRNKIRRQIRAILTKNKEMLNKRIIIKYLDKNEKPIFKELEDSILTNIN